MIYFNTMAHWILKVTMVCIFVFTILSDKIFGSYEVFQEDVELSSKFPLVSGLNHIAEDIREGKKAALTLCSTPISGLWQKYDHVALVFEIKHPKEKRINLMMVHFGSDEGLCGSVERPLIENTSSTLRKVFRCGRYFMDNHQEIARPTYTRHRCFVVDHDKALNALKNIEQDHDLFYVLTGSSPRYKTYNCCTYVNKCLQDAGIETSFNNSYYIKNASNLLKACNSYANSPPPPYPENMFKDQKNIPVWCLEKTSNTKPYYSGIEKADLQNIRGEPSITSQHHALIKKADLKYFDSADIENRIVPQLGLTLALKIIPTRLIELYNDGRHSFRVGKNYKGSPSLIHPLIDNFPYPVLQNNRKNGVNVISDMNLPQDYVAHQALTNQWNRVKDFVNDDGRIAVEEKSNVIKLLEPVGYLFRNAVRDIHIVAEQYPEKEEAIERLIGLAETYVLTHMIPEDVLNIFYQGGVDLHTLLQDVKVKTARHEAMVDDLFPVRLRGGLENIRNNLLESLVLHDMIDRFKLFYPYDVHRLG